MMQRILHETSAKQRQDEAIPSITVPSYDSDRLESEKSYRKEVYERILRIDEALLSDEVTLRLILQRCKRYFCKKIVST